MLIKTRRDFIKAALTSAGALGALSKFGEMNALASGSAPYQALVCIFLAGGNDSNNMVVPVATAQQSYSLYAQGRQTLAIPQASLLPIQNGADAYGVHPLMPEMANLYTAGNAAIVANVGMLVQPTTPSTFQQNLLAQLPAQLFSHSDQTNQWQAAIPNGTASTGWGGRVEDNLLSQYNASAGFTPMTATSGCGLFCTGQQTFAATVPVGGASLLQGANTPSRLAAVQQLMTFDNGLKLVTAANTNFNRGVGFSTTLTNALKSAKVNTVFPATLIGQQLLTVAQIMSIRGQLGIGRQVFFCQLGGFDTHSAQQPTQDPLLQQLSQAVGAFYTATQEVGTDAVTTTFTASEFGRTVQPNGNAGTDHAWGSHHFVIGTGANNGGSLEGGQIWGQFPSLALGGPNDANTRGTMVPTTSVDQYAATMALWFGVSPANIGSVFPYVGNFPSANIGFLG
ncbi:MAG TPA: DUF1501 domain-containing protein [Bryobacteraceae bacterium]|jgi:uncharacterized protein (DUF1501 family)|nr:DUF1501 domain-containing protein [Bryobacteraceae bacterium]